MGSTTKGIPGTAVAMATAGSFLLYVGIMGVPVRDGLKSLAGGKLPKQRTSPGEAIGKAEASLAAQGAVAVSGEPAVGSGPHPELARAAMTYLGVPYVLGGTTSRGLDCSGLVVLAFRKAYGVTPPRTTYVQITWRALERIPNAEIGAGDLLFWPSVGNPSHVGIAVSATEVIHAPRPGSKVKIVPIGQAFPGGLRPVAYRYRGGGGK